MADSQQQQIIALQQQVASLQAYVTTLSPRPSQRRAVLPDVDKFDGSPLKWDTWRPTIKAKLRVDGEAIGDATAQFYYVYFALESKVQAMVLPQLSLAEDDEIWDPQSILDQLARVCHNPNQLNEARDRLHSVKQGDDSLPTYIAKFERLLFEAKGHKWDNDRKISAFQYGLNSTLKNRLAQQLELPANYADYLRTVQKLSSRSGISSFTPPSSVPSTTQYSNSHSRPHSRHSTHRSDDPMDVSHIEGGINSMSFYEIDHKGQPTGIRHPDPIALIKRQQAAERLGLDINDIEYEPPTQRKQILKRPSSRQSYREAGACFRCGSFDHWLSQCPRPASPSTIGSLGYDNSDDDIQTRYNSSIYDPYDPRHPDAWQKNIFFDS